MVEKAPAEAPDSAGGFLLDLLKQLLGPDQNQGTQKKSQNQAAPDTSQAAPGSPQGLQHVIIVQPPAQAATAGTTKTDPAKAETGATQSSAPQTQQPAQAQAQTSAPSVIGVREPTQADVAPLQKIIDALPALSTLEANLPQGPDAGATTEAMNAGMAQENKQKLASKKGGMGSGGANMVGYLKGTGSGGAAGEAIGAVKALASLFL